MILQEPTVDNTLPDKRRPDLLEVFYRLTTDPPEGEPDTDDLVWAVIPMRASELDRFLALVTGGDAP